MKETKLSFNMAKFTMGHNTPPNKRSRTNKLGELIHEQTHTQSAYSSIGSRRNKTITFSSSECVLYNICSDGQTCCLVVEMKSYCSTNICICVLNDLKWYYWPILIKFTGQTTLAQGSQDLICSILNRSNSYGKKTDGRNMTWELAIQNCSEQTTSPHVRTNSNTLQDGE